MLVHVETASKKTTDLYSNWIGKVTLIGLFCVEVTGSCKSAITVPPKRKREVGTVHANLADKCRNFTRLTLFIALFK